MEYLRPSIGTAAILGLKEVRMRATPTTAYIMVGERCESNCSFCSQRRSNRKGDMLSRVIWPKYPTEEVIRALHTHRNAFSRICLQTLDYPEVVEDVTYILERIEGIAPVSVSMVPISKKDMLRLKDMGTEYLSIALDAANEEIFDRMKGKGVGNRFTWEGHWNALKSTVEIFGKGNTHIIVGLGESDEDIINVMERLRDMGVYTALFSYTPVNGGNPPPMGRYRAIQIAHRIIYDGIEHDFSFVNGKLIDFGVGEDELMGISKRAFMTSGCPGCNRPFYNERPGKELYNYPYPPSDEEYVRGLNEAMEYIRKGH